MNWSHLQAMLWLRWRLRVNRWRRDGLLNAIIMLALVVLALVGSVLAFFIAAIVGFFQLDQAEPIHLMLIWDGLVVGFLLLWLIDVITELQRSESLSFENLLHLPVSLTGTFLLNYLTSLVCFPLIAFLPIASGLILAMVLVKGPVSLVMVPLLAGYVLMITGVTYQFRGWLASLMINKRRRRTIAALVTMGFVALSVVPSVLNTAVMGPRRQQARQERRERAEQLRKAKQQRESTEQIVQPDRESAVAEQSGGPRKSPPGTAKKNGDSARDLVILANLAVPLGWLPYGARASAAGSLWPGFLCALAAGLIGAGSLWRSYRTTMRIYTGGFQAARPRPSAREVPAEKASQSRPQRPARLLEFKLSLLSEHANAVAMANLRALMRAPETKMMLLTPVILMVVFGSLIMSGRGSGWPTVIRPVMGIAAIAATMLGILPLLQNQFGFDRHGFRVFVLTPAPRREILLGKNLSVAPMAFGIALMGLVLLQVVLPMQWPHFLATLVQLVPIYAMFCLAGNLVSIIAPTAIKSGSLNTAKPKLLTVLIQLVCMSFYPIALLPSLIPLGIDLWLEYLGWRRMVPVYLLLSIAQLGLILWLYRSVLELQGRLLQVHERRILEIVTSQVE